MDLTNLPIISYHPIQEHSPSQSISQTLVFFEFIGSPLKYRIISWLNGPKLLQYHVDQLGIQPLQISWFLFLWIFSIPFTYCSRVSPFSDLCFIQLAAIFPFLLPYLFCFFIKFFRPFLENLYLSVPKLNLVILYSLQLFLNILLTFWILLAFFFMSLGIIFSHFLLAILAFHFWVLIAFCQHRPT